MAAGALPMPSSRVSPSSIDQRRRRVGIGRAPCQHRHRVGNAEREGAAAPARGGEPAHGHPVGERHPRVERRRILFLDHRCCKALARRQVEGDIAAVIDVGALEAAAGRERRQDLVGDGARHRRHGGDEDRTVGPDRRGHAPRHRAGDGRHRRPHGPAQDIQLLDQLGEQAFEAPGGAGIGAVNLAWWPKSLGHDIDGPVVQMQAAAVRQQGHLRGAGHDGRPPTGPIGQGFAGDQGRRSRRSPASTDSSATMLPTWPPRAAKSARAMVNSMGATRAGVGT